MGSLSLRIRRSKMKNRIFLLAAKSRIADGKETSFFEAGDEKTPILEPKVEEPTPDNNLQFFEDVHMF